MTDGGPPVSAVVDAVIDALADRGPDGLTLPEVALRAAAAGAPLAPRPDLDALVVAALEHVVVLPEPRPTGDLGRDLRVLLERWRFDLSREERAVAALLSLALWRPDVQVALHGAFDRPLSHYVAAVVARAAEAGDVPQQDVQTLVWVLRGLFVERLRSRPRPRVDIDALVEFLLTAVGRT